MFLCASGLILCFHDEQMLPKRYMCSKCYTIFPQIFPVLSNDPKLKAISNLWDLTHCYHIQC